LKGAGDIEWTYNPNHSNQSDLLRSKRSSEINGFNIPWNHFFIVAVSSISTRDWCKKEVLVYNQKELWYWIGLQCIWFESMWFIKKQRIQWNQWVGKKRSSSNISSEGIQWNQSASIKFSNHISCQFATQMIKRKRSSSDIEWWILAIHSFLKIGSAPLQSEIGETCRYWFRIGDIEWTYIAHDSNQKNPVKSMGSISTIINSS